MQTSGLSYISIKHLLATRGLKEQDREKRALLQRAATARIWEADGSKHHLKPLL